MTDETRNQNSGAPPTLDKAALAELLLDALTEGSDPGLLARKAAGAELTPEEQSQLDELLESSPRVRDELRVLENFDPSQYATAAQAAPVPVLRVAAQKSFLASLGDFLFSGPGLLTAATAGAAAALALYVLPGSGGPSGEIRSIPGSEAQLARAPQPELADPAPQAPTQSSPSVTVVARNTAPGMSEEAIERARAAEEAARRKAQEEEVERPPTKPAKEDPQPILLASIAYSAPAGARAIPSGPIYRGIGDGPGSSHLARGLAPAHVAHTVSASPTLFWHLAEAPESNWRFRFELATENAFEPERAFELPVKPTRAGTYRISLADLGIELKPGTTYSWSVLIRGGGPGKDSSAEGWIQRINQPASLTTQLGYNPLKNAYAYASANVWYDALASVMNAIEADPNNTEAKQAHKKLLTDASISLR